MSLIGRAKAKAESLMVDTCTIKPVEGESTDPVTGEVTPIYGPATYIGKCKIQNQRLRYPSEPVAGEHQWTIAPTEIHVPIAGTESVATGQMVTIDTSVDLANEGRIFRVRVGDRKSHGTALRLLVEEITA